MRYLLSFIFLFSFVTIGVGQNNHKTSKQNMPVVKNAGTVTTFSQADSINIKQIVEGQINAIKEKQLKETKKQIVAIDIKNETTPSLTKKGLSNKGSNFVQNSIKPLLNKIQDTFFYSEAITNKVKILGFASIISLLVVIIRRKIINRKFLKKDGLKDNIRLLREERVVKKTDIKLKGIRNSLVNNTLSYSNTQAGISKVAKEMSIAKGEVLLAAKIKSYELNKSW